LISVAPSAREDPNAVVVGVAVHEALLRGVVVDVVVVEVVVHRVLLGGS
jgi:hypothetical protein